MIIRVIAIYLFLSILFTSYLAAYSLARGRTKIIRVLLCFSFFLCVYLFGYLLELNSKSLENMVFWNQIQYLTLPFLPGLWLLFSLLYTRRVKDLTLPVLGSIFFIPAITFFLRFTNEYHLLFYSSLEINIRSGQPILFLGKGPWYLIHGVYIIIALVLVVLFYGQEFFKVEALRRKRYRIITIASILPLLGYLLLLLGVGNLGVDFGAILLPVSLFLLVFAVLKYDFLDLMTLAREKAFESSLDAYFLLDEENNLIDYNAVAATIMKDRGTVESKTLDENLLTTFQENREGDIRITQGEGVSHYHMKKVEILDQFKTPAGTIVQLGDITQRKQYEEALRLSEAKYRLLTEKMSDLLWVLDLHTETMRYVSPSVFNFCGYTVEGFLEKSLKEILTPASYQNLKREMTHRLSDFKRGIDEDYTDEIEQICNDGAIIITEVKGCIIYNQATDRLEYMGVSRDVTEQRLAQKKLLEMATMDSLTNLYNRRHFLDLAQKEFQRSQRYGGSFALLIMDVDSFKKVNDRYGHGGGDIVLKSLGQRIQSFFRSSDITGRIGGEEFAVLLVNTSLEVAHSIAERFRKTIQKSSVLFEGEEICCTISIGVTAYNQGLSSFDQLMQLADKGLYKAKRGGKDCSIKQTLD